MSLLNDNARCFGASAEDERWEAQCKDCLRRTEPRTIETSVMLPPLIVDEVAVCPLRVVAEVEGMCEEPEETSSEEGLICPYCGHLEAAAFELERDGASGGEVECAGCDRSFLWVVSWSATYYGQPLLDRKEGA